MLQKKANQKAAIKKEREKIVHYRLLLSIAILIFSYFHNHYHYCWKGEFRHALIAIPSVSCKFTLLVACEFPCKTISVEMTVVFQLKNRLS